jgi:hypothetical protein
MNRPVGPLLHGDLQFAPASPDEFDWFMSYRCTGARNSHRGEPPGKIDQSFRKIVSKTILGSKRQSSCCATTPRAASGAKIPHTHES